MTSKIKTSYLMWIGAEHYPTIEDFVKESNEMGVSKRLPNVLVAEALMDPGTVVFVAHDEGVYTECPKCAGIIECPECRKRTAEAVRLDKENIDLEGDVKDMSHDRTLLEKTLDTEKAKPRQTKKVKTAIAEMENDVKEYNTKIKRAETKIKKRRAKIETLAEDNTECDACDGQGDMPGGTGGCVKFNDGSTWDYRKYNYYLHQPQTWTPVNKDGVKEDAICEHCGGTGRLPEGKVFGFFLPGDIEYILKAEDTDKLKAELKDKGVKTITATMALAEPKRGCGFRQPGGVYVTTTTKVTKKAAKSAKVIVAELVAEGKVSATGAQIKGSFAEFLAPVDISSKRFRGIKRWALDPTAEDEAEMAMEAMEE